MSYQVQSVGLSHMGKVRTNNEDLFATCPDKLFFVLADGMGGHNAGEIAAQEAVISLIESISQAPLFTSTEEVSGYLLKATVKANRRIWERALTDRTLAGMGTTLSAFILYQDALVYAHVGDSRLYRFRKKPEACLEQLTKDHSLRSILIEESDIDPALLDMPGFKNVITRALGTQPSVLPDIGIAPINCEDIYLLCSDGLTDLVHDTELLTLFQQATSLQDLSEKLISCALEKGGTDNITVLLTYIQ